MMNRTSFAQTLRTGSSVTTCPICRADVKDTVALGASTSILPDAEHDGVDSTEWQALARQREQEVIDAAREMRGSNTWGKMPANAPPGLGDGLASGSNGVHGSNRRSRLQALGGAPEARDLQPAFGMPSEAELEPLESGGLRDGGERRMSNASSDAGGASSVRAMEARLAAMMDDDLDIDDELAHGLSSRPPEAGPRASASGAPKNGEAGGGLGAGEAGEAGSRSTEEVEAGWEPVGKGKSKGRKSAMSDTEAERRRKEAEEARKHAEWMKAQMKRDADSPSSSAASSQAASDASTMLHSPASHTPPEPPPAEKATAGGWSSMPPPARADISAAFATGFGAFPTNFGGLPASAASFVPPPPQREPPPSAPAAERPRIPTSGGTIDREQLLRTELGSLREQLQAKDAQCAALGAAAARTAAAEDRVVGLETELDRMRQELASAQRELATSQGNAQQAQRNDHGKDEAFRNLQTSHSRLGSEHDALKGRFESMWKELEDRDRRVASLERQLANIDRPAPPPPFAPPVPVHQSMRGGPRLGVAPGMAPPRPPPGAPGVAAPYGYARPPPPPAGARPQTAAQAAAARPRAIGVWKCQHCTFENRNPPIFDPHTREQVGFCEVCQNPTPLHA